MGLVPHVACPLIGVSTTCEDRGVPIDLGEYHGGVEYRLKGNNTHGVPVDSGEYRGGVPLDWG